MVLFFIPTLINFCFYVCNLKDETEGNNKQVTQRNNLKNDLLDDKNVIYKTDYGREKNIDCKLENYLIGVVAAEMPANFELEALKAQAVASRTYAIKNYDGVEYKNLYQAHVTTDKLKKNWGNNFEANYEKIKKAVNTTAGETIKYNNKEIQAVFHAMSSGWTENSENVWQKSLPYLKSVDSQDDKNAPGFLTEKKFLLNDLIKKINSRYSVKLTKNNFKDKFIIAQRSKVGYIKKINICGKDIDAMDLRFLLGLRSNNFEFKLNGDHIIFITKGFGHGAGMSQYGANFLAKKGLNYKQILKHYYSGVEIY